MKDLLVLYPHGLGDCILLTPAIREFYSKTKNKVHVATLERFRTARFFDNNPYVDQIFYTKDAWHDYPNSQVGFFSLKEEWKRFAKDNGFSGFVMPMHSEPINKILLNYRHLGIQNPANYNTEVHTTKEDVSRAEELISGLVGDAEFGFVQTTTGVPSKDLPQGYGRKYLAKIGIDKVIEIGKEFGALDESINVQFEILRRAKAVCIPDSVFYHACHAMGKKVDFVYFGRGPGVYERVRPLHKVEENIFYELGDLK